MQPSLADSGRGCLHVGILAQRIPPLPFTKLKPCPYSQSWQQSAPRSSDMSLPSPVRSCPGPRRCQTHTFSPRLPRPLRACGAEALVACPAGTHRSKPVALRYRYLPSQNTLVSSDRSRCWRLDRSWLVAVLFTTVNYYRQPRLRNFEFASNFCRYGTQTKVRGGTRNIRIRYSYISAYWKHHECFSVFFACSNRVSLHAAAVLLVESRTKQLW